MLRTKWGLLPLVVAVGLTGCATIPTGPSVTVLPGRGKTFEQFQADNAVCRQWASTQVGTRPGQASTEAGVSSAAIGAASGKPGVGAAIGGGGALDGTAEGLGSSEAAAGTAQWRYDVAYQQCMYAKGNQIPVAARSAYGVPPPPSPPPH